MSFQKRDVGTKSAAKTITLKNTGTGVLKVNSISTSAGFVETNTCVAALTAGESCEISVKFAPSVTGQIESSLMIVDNADNSPQVVGLSGKGIAAK